MFGSISVLSRRVKNPGCTLSIWAPGSAKVELALCPPAPPSRLPMHAAAGGWHECVVASAAPGTRYAFVTDAGDWEAVGRAHGEVFRDVRPASAMLVVAGLLDPAWRVEIEADAIVDD